MHFESMKSDELKRVLLKAGFVEVRQTGSHVRLAHENGTTMTWAFHSARSLPPGLVKRVLMKDGK